jgi:hypothetical protein
VPRSPGATLLSQLWQEQIAIGKKWTRASEETGETRAGWLSRGTRRPIATRVVMAGILSTENELPVEGVAAAIDEAGASWRKSSTS